LCDHRPSSVNFSFPTQDGDTINRKNSTCEYQAHCRSQQYRRQFIGKSDRTLDESYAEMYYTMYFLDNTKMAREQTSVTNTIFWRQDADLNKTIESISTGLSLPSPVSQNGCVVFEGFLFYRRYQSSDNWFVCISLHQIKLNRYEAQAIWIAIKNTTKNVWFSVTATFWYCRGKLFCFNFDYKQHFRLVNIWNNVWKQRIFFLIKVNYFRI